MLDAKQMQEVLTDKIRSAMNVSRFEGISIAPEDDDEDIRRPSIKIMTDTKYSKEMHIQIADTTVELYFYAEAADDYAMDCLEMQEMITKALMEGIETENDRMQPENVDCSMSGGVLAVSFTLEQMEAVVKETDTDMESLNLNIR